MARQRPSQPRPSSGGRISARFLAIFALLLVPSTAVWFFYRSLFQPEASLAGAIFLSLTVAWFWAYLLAFDTSSADSE